MSNGRNVMESIEKLRMAGRNMAKGRNLENHEECNLLLIIADEIEREIAEKYMPLPVVDGRPVHIGDELEWTDGYEPYERFTVGMIGRTYCDESYQDFAETHEHGISFGCCRWPKSDPIKELLNDHLQEREKIVRKLESSLITLGEAESEEDACDKLFAERIRELLGGERR